MPRERARGSREVPHGTCQAILKAPDLVGFTGIGHSVEDCLYQARWGMKEHVELLEEQGLPVPPKAARPTVLIQNEEQAA